MRVALKGRGGEAGRGGSGGCIHKAMKKCHEINIISTLTSNKNSLKNAMKLRFFFAATLNHFSLLLIVRRGEGGGTYPP